MNYSIEYNNLREEDKIFLQSLTITYSKKTHKTYMRPLLDKRQYALARQSTLMERYPNIAISMIRTSSITSSDRWILRPYTYFIHLQDSSGYNAFKIENPAIKGLDTVVSCVNRSFIDSIYIKLDINTFTDLNIPIPEICNASYDLINLFFRENNIEIEGVNCEV